jgi:type VI secretion system Hcp family effector
MADEVKKFCSMRVVGLDRYVRQGDSVRDRFDIMSFNHGIYADPQIAGAPRRVQIYDVSAVRECDAATPIFMRLCQTGDALPSVTFEIRAEKDGKEIYRMTYELLNARVSRVNANASVHGGMEYRPFEDIAFTFEKLRINVTEGEQRGGTELKPSAP